MAGVAISFAVRTGEDGLEKFVEQFIFFTFAWSSFFIKTFFVGTSVTLWHAFQRLLQSRKLTLVEESSKSVRWSGGGGAVDHPCIKIGYSEPTRFGRIREPRRVYHPSRERLGFFRQCDTRFWLAGEVLGFFRARFWLAADKNLVLGQFWVILLMY